MLKYQFIEKKHILPPISAQSILKYRIFDKKIMFYHQKDEIADLMIFTVDSTKTKKVDYVVYLHEFISSGNMVQAVLTNYNFIRL